MGNVDLFLVNNGGASVKNVQIRLNDPYGVFSQFNIFTYFDSYLNRITIFVSAGTSALNKYVQPYAANHVTFAVPAQSKTAFTTRCEWYGGYIVNPAIEAGTYHLSWSILFTVSSGSFAEPPNLTIPWDVTVIG
jgi:hypothetical protein